MKKNQKSCSSVAVLQRLSLFGAALRSVRVEQRLTHEDVAELCNFSRQTLSRIEQGDPSVAIGQVARYAEGLGATSALQMPAVAPPPQSRVRVRRTAGERGAPVP